MELHDKEESITSRLGVSDDRADMLQALLIAHYVLDFKKQEFAGEVELNDGYETCKAVQQVLELATSVAEGVVIGMVYTNLSDKWNNPLSGGIPDFVRVFGEHITDTDTLDTLAAKFYKEIKEQLDD